MQRLNPILLHELDQLMDHTADEFNLDFMAKYPNIFIFLQKTHETMTLGKKFGL